MDEHTEDGLRVVRLQTRPHRKKLVGPFDASARRSLFAALVATLVALAIGAVAITLTSRLSGDHEAITLPQH
jgi:hypothetical protein